MNKKKLSLPLLIFVLAFIIGFNMFNGYYYLENVYKFNLGFINKSHVSKVSQSNVWESIQKHYSDTLKMDINTYKNIYTSYSACDYIDRLLIPYYEQYGYDSVIASGLESNIKIANVYAFEKCCEIIGEKKLNKEAISGYLKKVSIDNKNYSGTDDEKKYIDYATDRLSLAISLTTNSSSSKMLVKHSDSNTYCWIANGLKNRTRLRFCHKGDYITATNHYITPDSQVEFITKSCIKIMSSQLYAAYIGDDIIMYDVDYQLSKTLRDYGYEKAKAYDVSFIGSTINGKYATEYSDTIGTFSFNLKSGKMVLK